MDCRGSNQTMSKVAAALVVLLLVFATPAFSSARLTLEDLSSITGFRRGLSESKETNAFKVDLMHVHHVDSPYRHENLTLRQRAQHAVKSSEERLSYFTSRISPSKKPFGMTHALTSPVNHDQGGYIMQISAGTPARTMVATLDTGSDLVWFQCTPCTTCFPQPDPLFDPTASSTYILAGCTDQICLNLPSYPPYPQCTNGVCEYNYNYGDKSFTYGSMAYESFSFASTDGSVAVYNNVGFGCGFNNGGTFADVDGLVGLGNGPLSLVKQLAAFIGPVFSYCLVSYSSAITQTSPLLLGSSGNLQLAYTPLLVNTFNPTFYYVHVSGITVNGQAVNYPPGTFDIDASGAGGFILDSGTTITQLLDAAYTPLVNAIGAQVSYPQVSSGIAGLDLCYDTSSVPSPVFPVVVFQFDGVDVSLPSDNVFLPIDNAGTYCFYMANAGPTAAISIYGNIQQQNFQIAYDIANSQVGFAPTTC